MLIEDRISGWCPLMEPHLPADFSGNPDGRPERISVQISCCIYVGRDVCQQGYTFSQDNQIKMAGMNRWKNILRTKRV